MINRWNIRISCLCRTAPANTRYSRKARFCADVSDVVHLVLLSALFEQLLKSDGIGRFIEGGLELLPGRAQFGRALRISKGGSVEDLLMHATHDVAERNLRGRSRQ